MTTVPLRLFGDDAPVCTTVSCLTLLMCAAHGLRQPLTSSRIPICITPMKFCDVATFRAIYRVVVWSFLALASGYWPQTDPDGKPWPEGSFRALKAAANERLADEYTGLFWEVSGDWKWLWQAFEMPWYYNCGDICHRCTVTKKGLRRYTNCSRTASRRLHVHLRDMNDYRAHFIGRPRPPLSTFDGFSVQESILHDWVHNGLLGIHPIACGSALFYLCAQGDFGGALGSTDRKVLLTIRLKRAWQKNAIGAQIIMWSTLSRSSRPQACRHPLQLIGNGLF